MSEAIATSSYLPPAEADALLAAQLAQTHSETSDQSLHQEKTDHLNDWEKLLQTRVIDVSAGVINNSHDYAETELGHLTTQRGVQGFVKRVIWGNLARDYKRLSLINRGKAEQIDSGNIHATLDGSQAEHDETVATVVQKFADGYIHEGENEQAMADVEHGKDFEDEIKGLVLAFATGSLDYDTLIEEKTRMINGFGSKLKAEDRNKGLLFADNIITVAQHAKSAYEHNVGLDRIDSFLQVYKGEARTGARTEVAKTASDRIVDKLYQTKVGSLVNETTLSAVVGTVMVINKFATQKVITAAGAFVTMGAGAGVIAGMREHARIGQERQTFLRNRAAGSTLDETIAENSRSRKLETSRYETAPANELTNQLIAAREAVNASQPMTLNEALASITAVDARIKMSDRESVDLIDYTSGTTIEQERLHLDIALAQAKVALKHTLAGASDEHLKAADIDSRDIDELISARTDAALEMLSLDVDAKDRVFTKLRRIESLKMGAIGFATGVAFGTVIQEVRAAFDPQLQGVFEDSTSNQTRRTLLAGIFHSSAQPETDSNGSSELFKLDPSGSTTLPNGYHINKLPTGSYGLYDPTNRSVGSEFHIGANGQFDQTGKSALHQAGFNFTEHLTDKDTVVTVNSTVTQSPGEFLHSNPTKFTSIHREFWYDNNTSAFDKNELRMDWGGADNTGIDKDGNYSFNVQHMTPNGSFHDNNSANIQELLKSGKIKVALSMTKGSQTKVFMVPLDKHGNAIIDAKSYIGRSLFSTEHGHATFHGAYAETAQITGANAKGETTARILSTVVGDNKPKMASMTVPHHTLQHHEMYALTVNAPEVHTADLPTEIPFVMPLYGRRGVERLVRPEVTESYGYIGNYVGDQNRRNNQRVTPFSPEIEADPNAEPDANKVTARYLRAQRPSYRKVIDQLGKQLDDQPRAKTPRVVVMIPAAAHQEGSNIFATLEQYQRQEGIGREEFEIVVFANNPVGTKRDKTINEIRRFQKAYPDVKVRFIERELESENAKIGYVRKAMTDVVLTEYQRRGVDLNDVLFISNDADSHWINPNYLRKMREKADATPETDAFLGFIEWGHDAYKAYPEILVGTRFMQVLDIQSRMQGLVASSGANFAFRPCIYSAVGGYQANVDMGEDNVFGRSIRAARSGATSRKPIIFAGMSTSIQTSARRAIDVLLKDGSSPAGQWDDFGPNDALRTNKYSMVPFDFDDPVAVNSMIERVGNVLNQTLRIYSDLIYKPTSHSYEIGRVSMYDNKTLRTLTRLLGGQGVEVRWNADGSFAITNSSRMVQKMRSFQATH